MDPFSNITNDEFVNFLNKLGVETYQKTFEFMLVDNELSGVMKWLFHNLDHLNCLTAREEYRYAELEKSGLTLQNKDLDIEIQSIFDDYEGIPLPGEVDDLEDLKLNTKLMKDRLDMLESQEEVLNYLINQNRLAKDDLSCEIMKLAGVDNLCKAEETKLGDECLVLAKGIENVLDSVVDVVERKLDMYSKTDSDKEISKQFFTFGPLDAYRQTQAHFRSHFDLYTTKRFDKKQTDWVAQEEELKNQLVEAKRIEDRLRDAVHLYIECKVDLIGEQAKLSVANNYEDVHPSQIALSSIEHRSATELSEQEESIILEQVKESIKNYVCKRTKLHHDTVFQSIYDVRHDIHKDLSYLHDMSQKALSLDSIVYFALRHEHHTLEEVLQFANDLMDYIVEDSLAVKGRMETMKSLAIEQETQLKKQDSNNYLLNTLRSILQVNDSMGPADIVKEILKINNEVKEWKERAYSMLVAKEKSVQELKSSSLPLEKYLFDGRTKQPNCWDRTVAALDYQLLQVMDLTEKMVADASTMFTSVKGADKNYLRRLWQWFLTDPSRLIAFMKNVQAKCYS